MKTVSTTLLGAFLMIGCADKEAIRRDTAAQIVLSAGSGGDKVIDPWAENIKLNPVVAEGVIRVDGTSLFVSDAFFPKIDDAHYELRGVIDGVNVGWSHGPTLHDPDGNGWIDFDTILDSAKPGVYDLLVVSVKVISNHPGFVARDAVDVVPTYARDRALLSPMAARALHCTGEGMGTICVIRIEIKANRMIEPAGDKPSSIEAEYKLELARLAAVVPPQELGDTTAGQVPVLLPTEAVQQETVETALPVSEEIAPVTAVEPAKVLARPVGKKRHVKHHTKRHHKR